MRQSTENRDQNIAKKIADAAEDGGRVVAIVGGAHLPGIKEHLPDEINPTVHRPVYGACTFRHIKEIVPPLFKAGLVLFSFYLLAVWVFSHVLRIYQLWGPLL
jgi:pheromone shutdown protein TraB